MDVGGTFIKSGLMSCNSVLINGSQQTSAIDSDGSKEQICNSLASAVSRGAALCKSMGLEPAGIGLCMPGPFNYNTGVSAMVHKFASIRGIPLKNVISDAIAEEMHSNLREDGNVPVVFGHDVNTQLLGEMNGGNAKGFLNVCLVSLGTGLGFSLAKDGKVLQNESGGPLISLWNRPCGEGIMEDHASKRGFYNTWEEVTGRRPGEDLTVARMGELASEGDATALEVFRRVGSFIGKNIRPEILAHQIGCLLFGGQISRSFRFMEDAVREELMDIKGLEINTVSDFSNAAFRGLVRMLQVL